MPRNPFAALAVDPYMGDLDVIYPGGSASGGGYPSSGSGNAQISDDAQIQQDAADLRELGYAAPDTWDAYDPGFRAAVLAFQVATAPRAGTPDGLIGPTTRGVIAQELAKKRAAPVPVNPGPPSPLDPLPPDPTPVGPAPSPATPGGPAVTPASATEGSTKKWLMIGGAVAAGVLALVIFSSGGKPKRRSNPRRRRGRARGRRR